MESPPNPKIINCKYRFLPNLILSAFEIKYPANIPTLISSTIILFFATFKWMEIVDVKKSGYMRIYFK